jgi:hypothetical protein
MSDGNCFDPIAQRQGDDRGGNQQIHHHALELIDQHTNR